MVTIARCEGAEPVALAAGELAGYLGAILDDPVATERRSAYDPDADAIWVGTDGALPAGTPAVDDRERDDAVAIDVADGRGVVAGTNPRAALIAVYRYLRELGCRWVRPGADGEVLPSLDALPPVALAEAADYRHRGVCLEGAVSEEHVREMIEWLPKVGCNSYFVQFFEGYPFFEQWYRHESNPTLEPEPFSLEDARGIRDRCVEAIEARGLAYHAAGHGWTARAVGLPGYGWDVGDVDVDEETRELLAEVDGERGIYDGMPANTELCYSNPEARERLVETIVEYAADHPEVDVLHVWGSDGHNNHCECADCRGTRPSDYYVRVLNAIDERLTGRGIDTRIAFLLYTDLLWPPIEEAIENEDRFVLMFAPITRSYAEDFGTIGATPEIPPYERNDGTYPIDLAENVAFLEAWREGFAGDGFAYDYHLMWDHYEDPSYGRIGATMAGDMRHLRDLGLNGNLSCQTQRAFLPTGVPMAAMAETLWDRERSFAATCEDSFAAAFGEDGDDARAYLEALGERFAPLFEHESRAPWDGEATDLEAAAQLAEVPDLVGTFRPTIERNRELEGAQGASWTYLDHHADLCAELAPALAALARGDVDEARDRYESVRTLVREREPDLHPVLDTYWFLRVFDEVFGIES